MKASNQYDKFVFRGKSCGIKNPVAATVFFVLIIMVVIALGILLTIFLTLKLDLPEWTIIIGILVTLVVASFLIPKLINKIWDLAKVTMDKTGLVLSTGRWPFRSSHHFLFSEVEVCDVEKWVPDPVSEQNRDKFVYCVRAHLRNGRFLRLVSSGDIKITSKEAVREINCVLAVENEALPTPEQSAASRRAPDLNGLLPYLTGTPPLHNELGQAKGFSVRILAVICLLIMAVIAGAIYGGYRAWKGINGRFLDALQEGNVALVETYMAFGFDPFEYNCLNYAVDSPNTKLLEMFLKEGADPNSYVDAHISRPLTQKELRRNVREANRFGLSFLRNRETDDYDDRLPLIALAAYKDRKEVVRYLLDKGVDVTLPAKQGRDSPFGHYTEDKDPHRKKYAWDFAKSKDIRYAILAKAETWRPAVRALFLDEQGDFDELQKDGADITSPLKSGLSPLRFAVKEDHLPAIKKLLSANGYQETEGAELLLDAIDNSSEEVVGLLLNQPIDLCEIYEVDELPKRLRPPEKLNALLLLAAAKDETGEIAKELANRNKSVRLLDRFVRYTHNNGTLQGIFKEEAKDCEHH